MMDPGYWAAQVNLTAGTTLQTNKGLPISDKSGCLVDLQCSIIDYYHCLSDNKQWPCTKVETAGSLPLGQSIGRDGWLFQA